MRVNIPKPCFENWEQMIVTSDASRFCASCQKCVVDFTNLSDKEILQKINVANGNVCGRFSSFQLERVLEAQTYKPRNYWTAFFSLALTSVLGLQNTMQAKVALKMKTENSSRIIDSIPKNTTETFKRDSIVIKGVIWDSTRNGPLCHHSIFVKDFEIGTQTDSEGNFELKINRNQFSDNIILVTVNPYLGKKEFIFSKEDLKRPIKILLGDPVGEVYFVKGMVMVSNNDSLLNRLIRNVLPKNK